MKVTLEIPDELLQRIKLRAARRKRKLKDEIAQLLEAGMAQRPAAKSLRKAPKPVRLRGRPPLSQSEIEAAIAQGRDLAEIGAEARARRTTRAAILRARLKLPAARGGPAPSLWDRMKDLVIHDEDAPADLASCKAHLRGNGRSRRR